MIIPDFKLRQWAISGGGLRPYSEDCFNPASVDLRWSGKFRRSLDGGQIGTKENWSEVCELEQVLLFPNHLVLLDTLEVVHMPPDCCGMIALKSSIGRMGLEHMHAGFIDCGFHGTITLEMCVMAPWRITLVKGQRIVQLMLMRMEERPNATYSGRYQNDTEPTPNR